MREGYAVTISKWGENILTIEHQCVSGTDLTDDDARAIWGAAEHLQSFVGDPDETPACFLCGSSDACAEDCPAITMEGQDVL